MYGKEFLARFARPGIEPAVELDLTDVANTILLRAEPALTRKIDLMYAIGEVMLLGDDLSPQTVVESYNSLDCVSGWQLSLPVASRGYAAALRNRGYRHIPDLPPARPRNELQLPEAGVTPSFGKLAEIDHTKATNGLYAYSDFVFSLAVTRMHEANLDGSVGPAEAGLIVKNAIAESNNTLVEVVNGWRGIITVERDYELGKGNVHANQTDFRVSALRSGGQPVPVWLPTTTEWRHEIHRLCSTTTEIETLLALQAWVTERQLPFVPVLTPSAFEEGHRQSDQDRNSNADVLLCSVLPGQNEIIPIQVKNKLTQLTREEYDPGVVLVAADHIVQPTTQNVIVKSKKDDRSHTGQCVSAKYGQLLERFVQAHPHTRSHARASKADKQTYKDALQRPFAYFDVEILPRISPAANHKRAEKVETGIVA